MCFDIKPEHEQDIENMFSAYIKQVIMQSRKKFDKSYRTRLQHEELTQDGEIEAAAENENHIIENPLYIEKYLKVDFDRLEDIFTDEKMHRIVKNLNLRHKIVLFLIFLEGKSEQEVSQLLDITRQGVNKIKNEALRKIASAYLKDS